LAFHTARSWRCTRWISAKLRLRLDDIIALFQNREGERPRHVSARRDRVQLCLPAIGHEAKASEAEKHHHPCGGFGDTALQEAKSIVSFNLLTGGGEMLIV